MNDRRSPGTCRSKFGRLLHSLHGFYFRKNVAQQTGALQQLKATARGAFGKDTDQLVP